MIVIDGYTLEYYKNRNQIIIGMPQTMLTPTDTVSMVINRKVDLTLEDQTMILTMVKYVVGERMNHDSTHCLDYDPKRCPMECYRAQLTAELKLRDDLKYMPMSWSHYINTEECYMHWPSYVRKDGAR